MATTPPTVATSVPDATADPTGPRQDSSVFAGPADVPVAFTLPAGWERGDVFVLQPDDAELSVYVTFYEVGNIYADGCRWTLLDPPVGPTVDDLVAAVLDVPDLEATGLSDVTVDGFHGKQIDDTVPDHDDGECQGGKFTMVCEPDRPTATGTSPNLWAQVPDQHYRMRIVDVAGTRLLIAAASPPDVSSQDRAALDEILGSIKIGEQSLPEVRAGLRRAGSASSSRHGRPSRRWRDIRRRRRTAAGTSGGGGGGRDRTRHRAADRPRPNAAPTLGCANGVDGGPTRGAPRATSDTDCRAGRKTTRRRARGAAASRRAQRR